MKNESAIGVVRGIGPFASGLSSGELLIHNGWPGVVVKDIIGTTEAETTIDGRPIIGGSDLGDGLGDLLIEGVIEAVDEAGTLADGDLVDRASPSGVTTAAASPGALNMGHVVGDSFDDGGILKVKVKLLGRPVSI